MNETRSGLVFGHEASRHGPATDTLEAKHPHPPKEIGPTQTAFWEGALANANVQATPESCHWTGINRDHNKI